MPIATYKHDEKGDHFIVGTSNREFSGKRLGVTFIEGEGRTRDPYKAMIFDEVYGYEIILPPGHPGWELTPDPASLVVHGREWSREGSTAVVIDDPQPQRRDSKGHFVAS